MKYLTILILLFALTGVSASSTDSLRSELSGLLKKREILFNQYSESLNKKSGIFGNKTKNDLRDSQASLKEIVEADNKIISVLNRTVDFRNYEKLNLSFDASSYVTRIENLTALNEKLIQQNNNHVNELKIVKAELKKYKLYNVMAIALFVLIVIYVIVRKFLRL